jgi:hypothetical protein
MHTRRTQLKIQGGEGKIYVRMRKLGKDWVWVEFWHRNWGRNREYIERRDGHTTTATKTVSYTLDR